MKQVENKKKIRFTAKCTTCKRQWMSDGLSDIPHVCDQCAKMLIVNDHHRLMSRFKKELERM